MSQNCVGLHKIPVMIRKVFPGTNLLFVFFIILIIIIITYFLNNNLFSFKICPGNANIGLTCIYHHYVRTSVQTLCARFAIVPECAVQNNCLQHTHTYGHTQTHKTLRALGLSILFFSITHFSTSFHKSPHLSLSFQLNLLILIPTPFSLSHSLSGKRHWLI